MSSADETTTTTETADTPRDDAREAMLATLVEHLGDGIVESHIAPGRSLWVRVTRDAWFDAASAARNALGCAFFDFLSGLDWMPSPYGRYEDAVIDTGAPAMTVPGPYATGYAGGDTRFQVFAHYRDVIGHRDVFFKADLPDDDLRVRSVVPLYAGAEWHERECLEMFGIAFDGHPDPRHIYLPTQFEGHPLRKDFPLIARIVKPWPGIVDVEPMPGGAADAEDETADAEAPA